MIYAGIGSRETPLDIEKTMWKVASYLGKTGYTLRSGGADGADLAFETGCDEVNGKKEIFIPWKGFNGSKSELYRVTDEAIELASKFHPAWANLKHSVRNIMARNCYQVLGFELNSPVDFIVCWTSDGKASGGTGQALRLAESLNIPIFNLFHNDAREKLWNSLKTKK